jgi:hypothetical protein
MPRLWILALGALLAPATVRATVLLELTPEQLTDQSAIIARAAVLKQQVVSEAGRLWTDTTLRVSEPIKGAAAGQLLVVRQPGGETPTRGMLVAGAAQFRVGEETLLFLRLAAARYQPVGMSQGKLGLFRDATGAWYARRDLRGAALMRRGAQRQLQLHRGSATTDVPLDQLRRAIQRRLRGAR